MIKQIKIIHNICIYVLFLGIYRLLNNLLRLIKLRNLCSNSARKTVEKKLNVKKLKTAK